LFLGGVQINLLKFSRISRKAKKIPGFTFLYRKIGIPVATFFLKANLLILDYKYNSNGLITDRNCEFIENPRFKKAFKAGLKQWPIAKGGEWTYHLNFWAIEHASKLEGDFVECGVFRGKSAMANMTYINFDKMKGRKYYLFDTYEGLDPKVSSKQELKDWEGYYNDTYEFVKRSFKKFSGTVVVRGSVPNSLKKVKIDKVAYLSLDMNTIIPEVEAMKYFWPKLVSGGIIILDDYAGSSIDVNIKQKRAHDNFAKSVGVSIFTLPSGQGMIIKP